MERRPEEHDRAKMGQFMGVAFWFASVPWMGETGECWESWVKNWEKNCGVCECWDISHACSMMPLDKHLQAFAIGMTWGHGQPYGSSSQLQLRPKVLLSLGFHYYQKNFQKQLLSGDFALANLPPKIVIFCSLRSIAKS